MSDKGNSKFLADSFDAQASPFSNSLPLNNRLKKISIASKEKEMKEHFEKKNFEGTKSNRYTS